MTFLITFFISSTIAFIWHAIEEKESSISDVCNFIIWIFIGLILVFSLIRFFLYDFYCEFFELAETLDYRLIKTNKIFEVCCTLSKIYLISLIAAFVISLIYMECKIVYQNILIILLIVLKKLGIQYMFLICLISIICLYL